MASERAASADPGICQRMSAADAHSRLLSSRSSNKHSPVCHIVEGLWILWRPPQPEPNRAAIGALLMPLQVDACWATKLGFQESVGKGLIRFKFVVSKFQGRENITVLSNELTNRRMISVVIGTNKQMMATVRHGMKLPSKIVPNMPMLVEMDEQTVRAPRIEGSLLNPNRWNSLDKFVTRITDSTVKGYFHKKGKKINNSKTFIPFEKLPLRHDRSPLTIFRRCRW